MSDNITVTGIVATQPKQFVTSSGLSITSFRLASGQRRFDRATNSWVDASTNWYSVNCFRQLAQNAGDSIRQGEHVVVSGRLRIRTWETAEKRGTSVEIEADAVGHDLTWCTTRFLRSAPVRVAEPAPAPDSASGSAPVGEGGDDGWHTGPSGDAFLPDEQAELADVDS